MSWEQRLLNLMVSPDKAAALPVHDDWERVNKAARAHRLTPLLHSRVVASRRDGPFVHRQAWALDFLRARQRAEAIAATVRQVASLLDAAAIPHAFLKGVHLAWGVYPEPVLRTMRDIDVLIDPEHVIAARDLLIREGFTAALFGVKSDEYALTNAKHLAPLIAPTTEITVELHHMLTDPEAELGAAIRFPATADLLAARKHIAMGDAEIAVLPDDELLLHIIYHTAYDHFFNNGPQIIADACFLVRNNAIDWPSFWQKAASRSMAAGAGLILAMCQLSGQISVVIPPAWTPDHRTLAHTARIMMRDNYADRVARSVTDLTRDATPRSILAAIRRKFASQRVIAANNAHLQVQSAGSGKSGRSKLSAVGDVVQHATLQQRRDSALRALLKDR